jgi:hypothetical protein
MQLPFGLPHGGDSVVVAALELARDLGCAILSPLDAIDSGRGTLGY